MADHNDGIWSESEILGKLHNQKELREWHLTLDVLCEAFQYFYLLDYISL